MGTPIADEDLAHVSPLLHRHVIPNGPTTSPELSRGATCRRIRYRMFSQPGGLWGKCRRRDSGSTKTRPGGIDDFRATDRPVTALLTDDEGDFERA